MGANSTPAATRAVRAGAQCPARRDAVVRPEKPSEAAHAAAARSRAPVVHHRSARLRRSEAERVQICGVDAPTNRMSPPGASRDDDGRPIDAEEPTAVTQTEQPAPILRCWETLPQPRRRARVAPQPRHLIQRAAMRSDGA